MMAKSEVDRSTKPAEPKRHHYVPIAYLRSWTRKDNRLFAYFADQPGIVRPTQPEAIGFAKHYYSFELPDGTRDHMSFEEKFGRIEPVWPTVQIALEQSCFDRAAIDAMYRMMGHLRVRGPAARDFNESLDLLTQRTSLKILAEMGKLPAKLQRYRDELDTVEMTINRQRTLAKIDEDLVHFATLLPRLGFEIVINATDIGFITSDNPVAYFPDTEAGIEQPYSEASNLELWFPLSPRHALHGTHRLVAHGHRPDFRTVSDTDEVQAINNVTARFAYRLVFASDRSQDAAITPHLATSPVLDAGVVRKPREVEFHIAHRFGSRPKLIKFCPKLCEDDLTEADFDFD